VRDLALIAVFAALIAALGLPGTLTPFGEAAPITAQTLGVMLAGSILGARRGALAVLTFLVLVAAGLPLLAGGRGGLSVFVGKSAGFLLGFLVGAWVIGRLVELWPSRQRIDGLVFANVVGGIVVMYACGAPVMAWVGNLSLGKAIALSAIYLPGDLIKVAVASIVTAAVVRGYPAILPADERVDAPS
jgi:biotin transport system substrate-specific component